MPQKARPRAGLFGRRGREVLVGLTDEESATLMAHRRGFSAGNRLLDTATLSGWLELAERHELARPCNAGPALPEDIVSRLSQV
jgi:hypothetical protein